MHWFCYNRMRPTKGQVMMGLLHKLIAFLWFGSFAMMAVFLLSSFLNNDAHAAAKINQKRVALVIGVSKYKYVDALANPQNDARLVSAALTRLKFDVIKLTDPTLNDLKTAQLDFLDKLIDADVAVLYYAGHSIQIGGANYIIPIDAKIDSLDVFLRSTFEVAKVVKRMDRLAKTKIIVLDACRDNPFLDRLRILLKTAGDKRHVTRGLAPISSNTGLNPQVREEFSTYGTIIAYAAAPGRTAADGMTSNSPYTTAFLKRVETPGLEVGRMFREVASDVIKTTHGQQKPEYLVRLTNEFYFLRPQPDECDYQAVAPLNQVGLPGIDFDKIKPKKAIASCRKALKKDPDHPRFLHNIGRAYDAATKYKLAVKYYRRSADLDFVPAINNLGVMYINGHGIKQNFHEGIRLQNMARARGNKYARVTLQETDFTTLFKRAEFAAVQKRLAQLGFNPGQPDGLFGEGSKNALIAYQKQNRLATNGMTLETLDHLKLIDIIPHYTLN